MLRGRESLYRTSRQLGRQAGRLAWAGMSQLLKHAGLLTFDGLSSFENNHTLNPLLTVVGLGPSGWFGLRFGLGFGFVLEKGLVLEI